MTRRIERSRTQERVVQERLRRIKRAIGDDLVRLRLDAAATKAQVAAAANVDGSFYGRIEAGQANASLETLIGIANSVGADLSIRLYAGSGPRLTDRHQARMVEALLDRLDPTWRMHLEVPVWRPVRGVVDGVLERADRSLLVVTEFVSTLVRLEQTLRWSAEQAASIGSSTLVGDGPTPPVSQLLVVRSTAANREIARRFEAILRSAFPIRTADAVWSLVSGDPWPGAALIWVRIDGDAVAVLDGPPRGVVLGR